MGSLEGACGSQDQVGLTARNQGNAVRSRRLLRPPILGSWRLAYLRGVRQTLGERRVGQVLGGDGGVEFEQSPV
jgi:hypothetical protein